MNESLIAFIRSAHGVSGIQQKFLDRIRGGKLTRTENPTSHFCVYFAAYDPADGGVFIGHHKKSGLWLFTGGHMNPGETPLKAVIREAKEEWGIAVSPSMIHAKYLLTLTKIEHPEKIICEWHYDLWHFLPFSSKRFIPNNDSLLTEFHTYGWKSLDEAANLLTSQPTVEALTYLRNLR